MNVRRGLFRLWIVLSLIFMIGVISVSYSDVESEFERYELGEYMASRSTLLLPVSCAQARGTEGDHYQRAVMTSKELCWYDEPVFRELYSEYDDLPQEQLAHRMYQRAGLETQPAARPWVTVGETAAIAVGIPIAVLLVGAAFVWAIAGFAPPRE